MALPTKGEISFAIESSGSILASVLDGYSFVPGIIGPMSYSGGFCIVFPFVNGNKKKAIRVWHQEIDNIRERYKILAADLKKVNNDTISAFEYISDGLNVNGRKLDITIMEWIEGKPLKDYILDVINTAKSKRDSKEILLKLAEKLKEVFVMMHGWSFSHGDLQHDNIIITKSGKPKFIDYDCFYTPSMNGMFYQSTAGYNGYQHPTRFTKSYLSNEKTDYFSEVVIYTSLIALAADPQLVKKYHIRESDWLLFRTEDYEDFEHSQIYKDLSEIGGDVQLCLDVLREYLLKSDINDLVPFEHFFKNDDLKEKVKTAYKEANSKNTEETYISFLNDWPESSYTKSYRVRAQKKLDTIYDEKLWLSASRCDTISSYQHYIVCSVLKTHISEAKRKVEEMKWNFALRRDTLEAFQTYLNETDSELHRAEADKKIAEFDEKFWKEARMQDTIPGYNYYLSHFPLGRYVNQARNRRSEIEQDEILWVKVKKGHSLFDYRDYLNKSKFRIHEYEANKKIFEYDEQEWKKASVSNTKTAYSHYLELFPNGKYVEMAYRMLSKKTKKKKWVTVFITCLMIVSICFFSKFFIGSIQESHKSSQTTSPPPSSPEIDMISLEKELEKKLIGMETAKKCGDPVNYDLLMDSKDLLSKIKTSSNYNHYKKRIDALVQ